MARYVHVSRPRSLRPATIAGLSVGMDRPASPYHPRFVARQAVPIQAPVRHSALAATVNCADATARRRRHRRSDHLLLGPAYLLDAPQPTPHTSDAIVVISGDEQMARFTERFNLYQQGLGEYLVFSGAAYDNGTSNADVMRGLAVARGIPDAAILEEPQGEDTWGNAVYTRQVLESHRLAEAPSW